MLLYFNQLFKVLLLFAIEVGPGRIHVHVEITCLDLRFAALKYSQLQCNANAFAYIEVRRWLTRA